MKEAFRLVFFTVSVFFAASLFAAPFDMIPADDPVLEDLRYLSLESGSSFPSFTPPLAPAEVSQFLNSLDVSLLSAPARDAYDRAKERLNPYAPLSLGNDNFRVSLNIKSTIEARARFNTDISWEPVYPKIPPALSLPVRLYFVDSLQLYFEPIVAADPEYYADAERFGVNIPLGSEDIDLNLPLRAFVAAGGSWWSFQLGRDRVSYGTGHMGNLAVSGNSAFYDFMRLSVFSGFFKYSVLVSQMPLQIKDNFSIIDPGADPSQDVLDITTQRYFYLHRLDFTLFNKLSVGLMEGLMVGNSGLEIRYLNPFIIFHSLYSSWDYDFWENEGHMNGSFLSLEINLHIINSLSVYGQFSMNEFATAYELDNYPDQPPNGLGYMAGINFSHSFSSWGSLFFFEFIRTDPYLYLCSSPFASFIQMRRLSLRPGRVQYYYLGYPRDVMAMTVGTKFFRSDILEITGEFSWLSLGEHNRNGANWDWEKGAPANQEKTPSGIVNDKFIVSAAAQWRLFPFLVFNGSVTGIFSRSNGHVSGSDRIGGQAALSVSFMY